jgi:hypothetical protein
VPDDRTFQKIGEQIAAEHEELWTRKDVPDRLYRMIDYAIKRQDWYEDQRNKTLSLAIGLLGLSSFLVAGLLNPDAKENVLVSNIWKSYPPFDCIDRPPHDSRICRWRKQRLTRIDRSQIYEVGFLRTQCEIPKYPLPGFHRRKTRITRRSYQTHGRSS